MLVPLAKRRLAEGRQRGASLPVFLLAVGKEARFRRGSRLDAADYRSAAGERKKGQARGNARL